MEARRYQRPSLGNIVLVIALLAAWLVVPAPVSAQGNLLTNGDFEQSHGDGVNLTAPPGWRVTSNVSSGLVGRQLKSGTEVVANAGIYSGSGSFDAYKGWAAFNITLYQTVSGIQSGASLRLEAFGRIWSCDSDPDESTDDCITGDGNVVAQDYTGATFRVGIDPTGSDDPASPNIVWSGTTAPYAAFQQMVVDARAESDRVTVYLNASMQQPARHQHVFWDAASLSLADGSASAGTSGQPAAPVFAAEVVPQGERDDGSIIHTVRSGDTIAAIAVAYNITIPELLGLNGMTMDDARFINPGQELIVKEGSGEAPPAEPADEGDAPSDEAEETGDSAAPAGDTQPIENYDPAPVGAEDLPALMMNGAVAEGQICVLLFEDTNPNRLQESGEGLLADGHVSLIESGGEVGAYTTDGQSEPHCFSGLPAGDYIMILTPPTGYGLTTASSYNVMLRAGQQVTAQFGAAAGFVPPQPPVSQGVGLFSEESGSETDIATGPLDMVFSNAGLILLGAAGVILIGGIGLSLLLRR
ncbi:MAG: LysM peptidoglycan-binding domain-containing protein [Anaerolineae bacterium]|nr:LysM peptidoglycan-binding domain-containing protein [Anaerolineae bacterium]